MIDKTCLNDKKLSFKAKGLHCYLMSLPDNWAIYTKDLINRSKDGRDAILKAFKELIEIGYVIREQKRKNGRSGGTIYTAYEIPQLTKKSSEDQVNPGLIQKTDFPLAEDPLTEDRPLISNKHKKKETTTKAAIQNFSPIDFVINDSLTDKQQDFIIAKLTNVKKINKLENAIKIIHSVLLNPRQFKKCGDNFQHKLNAIIAQIKYGSFNELTARFSNNSPGNVRRRA